MQQPCTAETRQVNGSSYYEYSTHAQVQQPTSRTNDTTNFANIRDTSGYGRNNVTAEVQLTGPMTSHITPGTNTTPALVAQALSGM